MVMMKKNGKKTMRKRRFKKSKFAVGATLQQRVRRPEIKVVDVPATSQVVSATGASASLSSIALGTDIFGRVGRQVEMHSLHFKAYFVLTGNAPTSDAVRVAIVYDRQPDGATAAFSDIFLSIDNGGGTTSDSFAFTNVGNWDRFKILADIHLPLIPDINAGALPQGPSYLQDQNVPIFIDRYIKLGGLEARYAAGATIPQSGQIVMVVKGLLAGGAVSQDMIFTSRLTYSDV